MTLQSVVRLTRYVTDAGNFRRIAAGYTGVNRTAV